MFEVILQKLLNNYLGKYIIGLDRDQLKVGLVNGDIRIQKVELNHEIIKLLNLPLKLLYSSIQNL